MTYGDGKGESFPKKGGTQGFSTIELELSWSVLSLQPGNFTWTIPWG